MDSGSLKASSLADASGADDGLPLSFCSVCCGLAGAMPDCGVDWLYAHRAGAIAMAVQSAMIHAGRIVILLRNDFSSRLQPIVALI